MDQDIGRVPGLEKDKPSPYVSGTSHFYTDQEGFLVSYNSSKEPLGKTINMIELVIDQ